MVHDELTDTAAVVDFVVACRTYTMVASLCVETRGYPEVTRVLLVRHLRITLIDIYKKGKQ